jgi:hypothetical protein
MTRPSHQLHEFAYRYIERGWNPAPVPPRTKGIQRSGWQRERCRAEDVPTKFANAEANIGLVLGTPSHGIVDVDCDCIEAVQLADTMLPHTSSQFGRASQPPSHWLYRVEEPIKTRQFVDPIAPKETRAMVVELRSTGAMTLAPPSIYPDGEVCKWARDDNPADVSGSDLLKAVTRLAAASLLARYWPTEGGRHAAALALAGGLLRADWAVDDVAFFVEVIATVAGDDEVDDRVRSVRSSAETIATGAPTTGWPSLAKLIDQRVVESVMAWLSIQRSPVLMVNSSYEEFAPPPPGDPETIARRILVQPFPIEVFPPLVQQHLEAGARNVGCPVDLLALPFLGYVAAVIGRWRAIAIKRRWVQRPTLWPGVVAASGVGKSPADAYVRAPLDVLQAEADERFQEQFITFQREHARWKNGGAKEGADEPSPPSYEHWYTTDPTMESLAPMLKDNPGVAAAFDELVGWIRGCNSYKKGGNDRQKYLEIWNGRSLKIDRKTQGVLYVRDPVLCVIGGIQPERLPELTREASVHDGLLARFLWTYPDAQPSAWDWAETDVDHLDEMVDLYRTLRRPVSSLGPFTFHPHPDTRDRWASWYNANQSVRGDDPIMRAFASKFPAQLATIWLLLESLWQPTNPSLTASLSRLEGAICIVEYARGHARRVATHFQSALVAGTGRLASPEIPGRIRAVLEQTESWISRTELSNALNRNVPAPQLEAALTQLLLSGVVEVREVSSGTNVRQEWRIRPEQVGTAWSDEADDEANSSYEAFEMHVSSPDSANLAPTSFYDGSVTSTEDGWQRWEEPA